MAFTRALTGEENKFCTSLGAIVIFWNHIEVAMRVLVQRATRIGEGEERTMVLVANLGNLGLSEALTAMADDHRPERKPHLKHCAKLFDAERIYRNYYVHNPVTFETKGKETSGLAFSVTAKGGLLTEHRGRITRTDLDGFHDRLSILQVYISQLISDSYGHLETPLPSLEMPPLPDKLKLPRERVIEL